MKRAPTSLALGLLLLLGISTRSHAQEPPIPTDQVLGGTGGDVEHVELSNGGVNLMIPLLRVKGRGRDYFITATYSSKSLIPVDTGMGSVWALSAAWKGNNFPGTPDLTFGAGSGMVFDTCIQTSDPNNPKMMNANFNAIINLPDGSSRMFPNLQFVLPFCNHIPPMQAYLGAYSADLSGSYQDISAGKFIEADGGTPWQDSNGNSVGTIDTAGRTVMSLARNSAQSVLTLNDGRTIIVKYITIHLTTSFTHGGANAINQPSSVVSEIDLPNGRAWKFQYQDQSYGQLTKVTFPTGGYIRYVYAVQPSFVYDNDSSYQDALVVTDRYFSPDGVTEFHETYSYVLTTNPSGIITQRTVTVTKATGDVEVHTFQDLAASSGDLVGEEFHETDVEYRSGATTALERVHTDWTCDSVPRRAFVAPDPSGNGYMTLGLQGTGHVSILSAPGNCRKTAVTTTTLDGPTQFTKQIQYQYDASLTGTFPSTAYNGNNTPSTVTSSFTTSFGNITKTLEYDWGTNGTPGPLLRQTEYTYLTTNPQNGNVNYLAPSINIVNKPILKVVKDGSGNSLAQTAYEYDGSALTATASAPQHDYTGYPSTSKSRGNLTKERHWLNTTNTWLETTYTYDDLGNRLSMTDPKLNVTAYAYDDAFSDGIDRHSRAYLTKVTQPTTGSTAHVENFKFYYATGLPYQNIEENGLITTFTYDAMNRAQQITLPDSGQTTLCYSDISTGSCYNASLPLRVTTTRSINNGLSSVSTISQDGAGRAVQSQLNSDPQGTVLADTTYDSLGRVSAVSNPYRTGTDSTSSLGTTTYAYDALGRKKSETYPDGAVLTTVFCGPWTLVTDPTGKWRRSRTDGLGRLVEVDEPNAPGATVASTGCPGTGEPIWVTSYSYDVLGNLTQVVQNGSRQRNFTYDSLSRLLTSSNPETGAISYAYDANSNLASKTDARSITTNYSPADSPIDALNRVTKIAYSNGDPSVTFTYDQANCLGLTTCSNIGHRTSVTDAAGSESWAYQVDPTNFRSIHKEQRATNSVTKSATYVLDLAGNITQLTYPTGRVVNYTYDAAKRPSTATDSSNGITYATDFQTPPSGSTCLTGKVCYTPQGTFFALSIGQSSAFTGLNLKHTYNPRLQPNEFSASSSAGNAIDISYSFVDPATTKNAGHVYGITNNLDTTRSQTFTYDQLNRITGAQTTSTHATSAAHCWSEVYTIDPWANLQSIAATTNSNYTGCNQESGFTKTPDTSNHLSGLTYDSSGNTTNDGVNAYTWNAESQMKTGAGVTYTYDGDGRRVQKSSGKLYWYGSGGEILAETDALGATQNEYIFFGGQRIAMIPAGSNPLYYVEDLLGTSRVITQSNGTVCYDADFYPFGGERTPYVNTCPQNYKFEGKERDTETGNDDFGARYYSNRFGRWLSADWSAVPAPVPYANLSNPQTLNLYAMVADDPESFADLDGHEGVWDFVAKTIGGIENAMNENNGINMRSLKPPENSLGRAIGNAISVVQGGVEVIGGAAAMASGGTEAVVASPTVVGSAPGVALAAGGALAAGHGLYVLKNALTNTNSTSSSNDYKDTAENQKRMEKGQGPVGKDGHTMELHHPDQEPVVDPSQFEEKTRTDHRLGDNFKKNHPNTGQEPTKIDRNISRQQNRKYWKNKAAKNKKEADKTDSQVQDGH